ncbi:tetratricopeptide repeat protein [Parasphingorhabdus sp.]|uniref:tetratricopeptide repeat protein n=1 Tax=Parasphingorhabdus sp. TaxID=2709688 RepID=UPI002B2792FB|nr:tetratricopeptide repeat protein [Parasphingorhabdus sp.]
MDCLLSAQAGIFALKTARGYEIEKIESGEQHECNSKELNYYFTGCNDVEHRSETSVDEIRRQARFSLDTLRAVRLTIMLFDEAESVDSYQEIADALEDLLYSKVVVQGVECQLFSANLPNPVPFKNLLNTISDFSRSHELVLRIWSMQPSISRVIEAFELVPEEAFSENCTRKKFWELAVNWGCVRELTIAATEPKGIDGALFSLLHKLKDIENNREIIRAWTSSFKRVHAKVSVDDIIEPEEAETSRVDERLSGRKAFEQAMLQQSAILQRIRENDFETAKRFARDMVTQQRRSSEPEHIAKSLTSISQKAKLLQVYDLALEWAQWAAEIKNDDPKTHAQIADILIKLERFVEAEKYLDLTESHGEKAFAETGRARILRQQGHTEDALNAFRAALKSSVDTDEEQYNWAGVAECLKDLHQYEDALNQYNAAIQKFSYESVLHAGKASILAQIGLVDEAITSYETAAALSEDNVVPRSGLAQVLQNVGRFEDAESLLRELIEDFPFDKVSQIGLSMTLCHQGKFDEALEKSLLTIENFPTQPESFRALAYVQSTMGEFKEAEETLNTAISNFPHNWKLRTSLARVEQLRGDYIKALSICDSAFVDFPSVLQIQASRAGILRRLGNVDEAFKIYQKAFEKQPYNTSLKNGLLSINIYMLSFDAAQDNFIEGTPRTRDEWRNSHLQGMYYVRKNELAKAAELFETGLANCPFAGERRMFGAGLTSVNLRIGGQSTAVKVSEACNGNPTTELFRFHALAKENEKGPARALFEILKESYLPENYNEVRDEIARQYNVVPITATRSESWIYDRQDDILILEAA